jgi:hypothetical protein
MIVALLASCFSEPSGTPSDCELGTIGCHCGSNDVCESSELACRDAYCIPVSCELGEKYCQCDAGACDDSLICQDGAICLPPAGSSDTTGDTSAPTTTDTTGDTSAPTTVGPTTGDSTTTTSADTGTPLAFCDATPEAIFCGDFDDGTYDPGFSDPVPRGGGTVEVLEDAMASSPPYALRVTIPVNGDETGGLLAASYAAPLPFVGTARTAVRFEPGCFDGGGAPERRVLALSFYAARGGFVGGVRIDISAHGGHLYQSNDSDTVIAMLSLDELEVTDTWMEVELGIDATTGSASVRVDGDEWGGLLMPMPTDIIPYITVGPISDSNPTACTVWFDDIAVLP